MGEEGGLVSWYFEPSHPQRITSGLRQVSVCLLLHICTQVIKQYILNNNNKSVPTEICIEQNIHKHQTQNFRRISPFGIAPVKKKKAHKARTRWYRGPFRRFINTRFIKQPPTLFSSILFIVTPILNQRTVKNMPIKQF